jgi:hypothetical protein
MIRLSSHAFAGALILAMAPVLFTAAYSGESGECLLQVDGQTYIDGPCNIELVKGGSFSIAVGETQASKYSAHVTRDPDTGRATGFWNGADAAPAGHEDLGNLVRDEGCWFNERAKVCAWKPGTRPK